MSEPICARCGHGVEGHWDIHTRKWRRYCSEGVSDGAGGGENCGCVGWQPTFEHEEQEPPEPLSWRTPVAVVVAPKGSTQQSVVLHRLREGPLCSQSFFHEDANRKGLTHRVAATVFALKERGYRINTQPCNHVARRGARHYILEES